MTVIVTFMKITVCNGNIRRHGYRLELAERWWVTKYFSFVQLNYFSLLVTVAHHCHIMADERASEQSDGVVRWMVSLDLAMAESLSRLCLLVVGDSFDPSGVSTLVVAGGAGNVCIIFTIFPEYLVIV